MISAEDPLVALKKALSSNASLSTVSVEGGPEVPIAEALYLQIKASEGEPSLFSLDASTSFNTATGPADLRTIVQAWLLKDLSVADYISKSDDLGLKYLRFLNRSQLISWLSGDVETIDAISGEGDTAASAGSHTGSHSDAAVTVNVEDVAREQNSEALKEILQREENLLDHNSTLHGSKDIDFKSVSNDCRRLIFDEAKAQIPWTKAPGGPANGQTGWVPLDERKSSGSAAASKGPGQLVQEGKNKEPIILISSSPSSLLNMANAKDFLEAGEFKATPKSLHAPNILRISRDLKHVGKTRFILVDNVENFKPEYWGRVVAVFVTGQAWQFKPYYWSDPHQLFRHCLGFCLIYNGDPVPAAVTQWNSKVEVVDRMHRFRDTEVVERIWSNIEEYMISRGWPLNK